MEKGVYLVHSFYYYSHMSIDFYLNNFSNTALVFGP